MWRAHKQPRAQTFSVCIGTLNASQTQAIRAASEPNGAVYQGNYNTNRVGGGYVGRGGAQIGTRGAEGVRPGKWENTEEDESDHFLPSKPGCRGPQWRGRLISQSAVFTVFCQNEYVTVCVCVFGGVYLCVCDCKSRVHTWELISLQQDCLWTQCSFSDRDKLCVCACVCIWIYCMCVPAWDRKSVV